MRTPRILPEEEGLVRIGLMWDRARRNATASIAIPKLHPCFRHERCTASFYPVDGTYRIQLHFGEGKQSQTRPRSRKNPDSPEQREYSLESKRDEVVGMGPVDGFMVRPCRDIEVGDHFAVFELPYDLIPNKPRKVKRGQAGNDKRQDPLPFELTSDQPAPQKAKPAARKSRKKTAAAIVAGIEQAENQNVAPEEGPPFARLAVEFASEMDRAKFGEIVLFYPGITVSESKEDEPRGAGEHGEVYQSHKLDKTHVGALGWHINSLNDLKHVLGPQISIRTRNGYVLCRLADGVIIGVVPENAEYVTLDPEAAPEEVRPHISVASRIWGAFLRRLKDRAKRNPTGVNNPTDIAEERAWLRVALERAGLHPEQYDWSEMQ